MGGMDIKIRQGLVSDASQAVPLLLSAAEDLLVSVFGNGDTRHTLDFLTHAWKGKYGQYGCNNHWVAVVDDVVVGVITAWHTKLGPVFDRASLDSITTFYSLDDAMAVLMRNQAVAVGLTPPSATELMLGHVAVDSIARRGGIGRAMIAHMRDYAIELNKQALVLDVQISNIAAIRFYQNVNFKEQSVNGTFVRFVHALSG